MMRIRFGLILKITKRTKFYPIHLPYPPPYNAQLARCLSEGLSLQESTEVIQLIKYLPTLFNLSHLIEGCDLMFSRRGWLRHSVSVFPNFALKTLRRWFVLWNPLSAATVSKVWVVVVSRTFTLSSL